MGGGIFEIIFFGVDVRLLSIPSPGIFLPADLDDDNDSDLFIPIRMHCSRSELCCWLSFESLESIELIESFASIAAGCGSGYFGLSLRLIDAAGGSGGGGRQLLLDDDDEVAS